MTNKRKSYRFTFFACYAGYITQSAVNNLAPILFIVFRQQYGLGYDKISTLILVNFITQLAIDAFSIKLSRMISVRSMVSSAHFLCAAGLAMMGVLPLVMADTFAALLCSVVVYAVGGGLIEVIISPIVEAVPADSGSTKAAAMSLLHSFYCWGQVAVVLISTLFLQTAGHELWYVPPLAWAVLPFVNGIVFTRVRIPDMPSEHEGGGIKNLMCNKAFLLILLLMLCAGASELAMSQWSSLFAQNGLNVDKALGDILGPCLFAVLMGTGRALYGAFAKKINIYIALGASGALCVGCYLVTAISDNAAVSLAACAVCGLSVAVMWPGTFSLAASRFKSGATSMYSVMALAGDLGCATGPFLAGIVCSVFQNQVGESEAMKSGLGAAVFFPALLILCVILIKRIKKQKTVQNTDKNDYSS